MKTISDYNNYDDSRFEEYAYLMSLKVVADDEYFETEKETKE